MGWSGRLFLAFDAKLGVAITDTVARAWAKRRGLWGSQRAYQVAYREADGWLLPKPGGGVRPISAPMLPRRLASAADARRVRQEVSGMCKAAGQIGLEGEGPLLARSMMGQFVVRGGGTVVLADRSNSYQTFRRGAVIDAVGEAVGELKEQGHEKVAAALARMMDRCFLAVDLPVTRVSFGQGTRPRDVTGLAQGCSSSGVFQAIVLARHLAGCEKTDGVWVSAAHDDLMMGTLAAVGSPVGLSLPDTSEVGGCYNQGKAVAVGARAAEMVGAGLAAEAREDATAWGRAASVGEGGFRSLCQGAHVVHQKGGCERQGGRDTGLRARVWARSYGGALPSRIGGDACGDGGFGGYVGGPGPRVGGIGGGTSGGV